MTLELPLTTRRSEIDHHKTRTEDVKNSCSQNYTLRDIMMFFVICSIVSAITVLNEQIILNSVIYLNESLCSSPEEERKAIAGMHINKLQPPLEGALEWCFAAIALHSYFLNRVRPIFLYLCVVANR